MSSQQYPIIANWVKIKSYAHSFFSYIFLTKRDDEGTPNASFSDLTKLQIHSDPIDTISLEDRKIFELIHREELHFEAQFYCQGVSNLIRAGDYRQALSLLDNPKVPLDLNSFALNDAENSQQYTDTFLKTIIDKLDDKTKIFNYVARMNDSELVATLTLQHHEKWRVEVCV